MDWLSLQKDMPKQARLPARATKIVNLTSILMGKQYDHLKYDFSEELTGSGEHILLSLRRPSVKANLCRTVVMDSVSLLFSEGHFPTATSHDPKLIETINKFMTITNLNSLFIDAATRGSVGSIAILMKILKNRVFFEVMDTPYLTPVFDRNDPDSVVAVTELYITDSDSLISLGYTLPEAGRYFFRREWTTDKEIWYLPYLVSKENPILVIDEENTITHGLGFCPIIWIKNLSGGDKIDGSCTFEAGIDTALEVDYQLSQAGRGLKYASDPRLIIRDPMGEDGNIVGGVTNAIRINSMEGDVKFLEINGTAAQAVLIHVRYLRSLALEAMHGNRSDADKLNAAQSGRAMEMMNQGLIWLADKLRTSYGQNGLVSLIKMFCKATKVVAGGIILGGETVKDLDENNFNLIWPRWYAPSSEDRMNDGNTYAQLIKNGVLSRRGALKVIASDYDIEDIDAEIAQIEIENQEGDARKKDMEEFTSYLDLKATEAEASLQTARTDSQKQTEV